MPYNNVYVFIYFQKDGPRTENHLCSRKNLADSRSQKESKNSGSITAKSLPLPRYLG